MPLDERAKRRPDFAEGIEVVLADGQVWQLRRPLVRFAPADNDLGFTPCLDLKDCGAYDAMVDAYDAALSDDTSEPATRGRAVFKSELALGRAVLLGNYDLTPAEVAGLLRYSWSDADPEGCRLREQVTAVALGRDPKHEAAGEESSPTPAE